MNGKIHYRNFMFETKRGGGRWECLKINVVPTRVERVVPPAGEAHAFDVQHYKRTLEIYVSPTGRSVRIYVDGVEVKP